MRCNIFGRSADQSALSGRMRAEGVPRSLRSAFVGRVQRPAKVCCCPIHASLLAEAGTRRSGLPPGHATARNAGVGAMPASLCSGLAPRIGATGRAGQPEVPGRRQRGSGVVARAMFDALSRGLDKAREMVRLDGKLTADNIKGPMREIRRALLEADVSLAVVRRFVKRVEEKALGVKVLKGVTPDQQLVKVVNDELIALMGSDQVDLENPPKGKPAVILMAGLQGVGKTTAAGKLAKFVQEKGGSVAMVSCDVYRPAAIEQLAMLGERVDVPVYRYSTDLDPVDIAESAMQRAEEEGVGTLIVDTAGRQQVDESMMVELKGIQERVQPTDTLLVVDAMTGQEAANLTRAFDEAVGLTGAVVTKMDGDSRGGAALSVREVSGKPIKFTGTGEKLDALEPFYPDRMASRILGMGDILTLVEKAEAAISEEDTMDMMEKVMRNKFDLDDFIKQYKMINNLGGMGSLTRMLPGMSNISDKQLAEAEKKYKMYDSMIRSMTKSERKQPELLTKSSGRRRRVALGSGRTEAQVQELLALFTNMRIQMKTMQKMMAVSGAKGAPGMPSMSDDEMMSELMAGLGPQPPRPGTVRRRRRHTGKANQTPQPATVV